MLHQQIYQKTGRKINCTNQRLQSYRSLTNHNCIEGLVSPKEDIEYNWYL